MQAFSEQLRDLKAKIRRIVNRWARLSGLNMSIFG